MSTAVNCTKVKGKGGLHVYVRERVCEGEFEFEALKIGLSAGWRMEMTLIN